MPGPLADPGSSAGAGGALTVKGFYRHAHSDPRCPCPRSAASHPISVFTDSTGEARAPLGAWCPAALRPGGTRLSRLHLPSRALGMLSCYIQEDSGPHMQKAWEKAACRFFFFFFLFVTGLERLLPAQHQGLPGSQVPWSRMDVLCSWSVGFLGPCSEHIHPATALLVTLRQGHWEPDLGSGIDECLGVRTAAPMLYRAARIVAKLLYPFSMRLPVTWCQWVMCVL